MIHTGTNSTRYWPGRLDPSIGRQLFFAQAVEENNLQYASAHWEGKRLQFDDSAARAIPSSQTPHDMASFLSQDATNWPLFNSFFPPKPTLIVQALISRMGTLVSDGSYKEFVSRELGTASWIFECGLTGASCRGVCQTSSLEHEVNAYWSELQGIHTGLIGMLAFCSFHDITGGSFRIGCDNEVGVDQADKWHLNVPIRTKHADLIRAIHLTIRKFKARSILVTLFHISGHQDDVVPFADLDCPLQLNVLMDAATKVTLDQLVSAPFVPTPSDIKFEGWSCWIKGIKMTIDAMTEILRVVHKLAMKDYLTDPHHNHMSLAAFDLVDWTLVWSALLDFSPLFHLWASKHVSHYCPVGHMQIWWQFWDHDHCPCCQQDDEMTTHLLMCPHFGMRSTWFSNVTLLQQWLEEVDTHLDIIFCFIKTLESRNPHQLFSAFSTPACQAAAVEQDSIGWQNFTEGKLSKWWRQLQALYYWDRASRQSVTCWVMGLVTQLLEMVHGVWKYLNSILHEHDEQGLT